MCVGSVLDLCVFCSVCATLPQSTPSFFSSYLPFCLSLCMPGRTSTRSRPPWATGWLATHGLVNIFFFLSFFWGFFFFYCQCTLPCSSTQCFPFLCALLESVRLSGLIRKAYISIGHEGLCHFLSVRIFLVKLFFFRLLYFYWIVCTSILSCLNGNSPPVARVWW
jgi:hypothetical protein